VDRVAAANEHAVDAVSCVSSAFRGIRADVYSNAKANGGSFAAVSVCSPRRGDAVGRCDAALSAVRGRCKLWRKEEHVREAIRLDGKSCVEWQVGGVTEGLLRSCLSAEPYQA